VSETKGGIAKLIIGLDMGGTNVDGVVIDQGEIVRTSKRVVNRSDLLNSIYKTLEDLIVGVDTSKIESVNLSTTICTNAIVENKTSTVGMIIESGPGIKPGFLACGQENVFITGYIDHRGNEIKSFRIKEVLDAAKKFKSKNINSVAVVTKFSVRCPGHEIEIGKLLENEFPTITLGHTISGRLNFPRRVLTSYLNSAVYSTFREFSKSIKAVLPEKGISSPVHVLKADGGTLNIESAEKHPVYTVLSGPAASLLGISALLPTSTDAVLLDIGGTTTDIFFLADGVPLFEPQGIRIGKYPTLVRAIFSASLGLGGDSSISVEDNKLIIGPHRDGLPMAFGGPKPTPSDAFIVLGLLDCNDKDKAFNAMNQIGLKIGLDAEKTAKKVVEKMCEMIKSFVEQLIDDINNHPVYTVKELLYGKKLKPCRLNVVGGPAKALSKALGELFNLPCSYPENYELANAIGSALARTTTEITLNVDTEKRILTVPELGIYEKTPQNYSIEKARSQALELVRKKAWDLGAFCEEIEPEITEESSFNMVRGFYTSGKNIRIKAQVKPGLIKKFMRCNKNAKS
jgi:N-methylhydantoinase A/oxoprolinase/acetone carboxylase beta subunit